MICIKSCIDGYSRKISCCEASHSSSDHHLELLQDISSIEETMPQKRGNRGTEHLSKFAFYIVNTSYKGPTFVQNNLINVFFDL